MRSKPLLELLQSVQEQTLYPDEILIIDGSTTTETEQILKENPFQNLSYYLVSAEKRGLTKQRNFGIELTNPSSEVVCFLDDDTVLEQHYFEEIIKTYQDNPSVSGVGGVAINENKWVKAQQEVNYNPKKYYQLDGYVYKESTRTILRNYLGLQSNLAPGKMPLFSHGLNCGFPLNNAIYEVDLLIGMSCSFRKKVVNTIRFSTYFEGYGLYEDADFSLRALQFGKNVINTKARLQHFHHPSGRPNPYKYGKMVVRNGWYVWRIKNPKPVIKDRIKWHSITILLTIIRFLNTITTKDRREAFSEAIGRTVGWWSLLIKKPKVLNGTAKQ
jgi:GT2 family glycosyltransferase